MRKRCGPKLAEIKEELRRRRHQRIADQGQWLKSVVSDYFAYRAVPTNGRSLSALRYHVVQVWFRSLRRLSQRHNLPWDRMNRIIDGWIPPAIIRHPWPSQHFDVKHPRQEPSALAAHALICAGAQGDSCPYRDCPAVDDGFIHPQQIRSQLNFRTFMVVWSVLCELEMWHRDQATSKLWQEERDYVGRTPSLDCR
jgi:hypothetical protein